MGIQFFFFTAFGCTEFILSLIKDTHTEKEDPSVNILIFWYPTDDQYK